MSIDDRMQWVYYKLMAHVSYFFRLGGNRQKVCPIFWKNVKDIQMFISIQNALKVMLLPLLLNSSMQGMQSKISVENYDLHKDDKTEADRIATLAAHNRAVATYASPKKSEQADDDLFLESLGNPTGPSLWTSLAVHAKEYKEKKNKKACQLDADKALKFAAANPESQKYLEFDKFYTLPLVLQQKIMGEYYHTSSTFILRHKRELAPLLYHVYPSKPLGPLNFNAHTILSHIDTVIATIKKEINEIIVKLPESYDEQMVKKFAPSIWVRHSTYTSKNWWYWNHKKLVDVWNMTISLNHWVNNGLCDFDTKKEEVEVGDMLIIGYSDRTYDILLNSNQLKQLANRYSMAQLSFFVDLANKQVPENFNPRIQLTGRQCALFKSLDYEMQGRLKKLYPWVDFYCPNDCKYNFCDKMGNLPDRVLSKAAFDAKTSYNNSLMWWKNFKLSSTDKFTCAAIAVAMVIEVISVIHATAYSKQ